VRSTRRGALDEQVDEADQSSDQHGDADDHKVTARSADVSDHEPLLQGDVVR
jgi:hypothetical protein